MRKTVVCLALGLLALYHANGRPHPEADCMPAPYAAWALLRHGSLDLRRYPEMGSYLGSCVQELPDGSWASRYPPGSTLAMLPFVAPLAVFRGPLSPANMIALGKLAAACYVAAAGGLFFLVCRQLASPARWPATILLALGTCLCSVASQAIWMHGPATFWVCLALYLLLRRAAPTPAAAWLAGLALGMAVITRPTTAFVALATGLALLAHREVRRSAWLALGGALPVAGLCLLNQVQFGHPILGGYAGEYQSASPPLWLGLTGLLAAPSRGALVYSPALLLVPFGAVALCRRRAPCTGLHRSLLLAWLAAAGLTLLYYARWHDWKGGWCYGPRFLCEIMPLLCLVFAVGYERLGAGWRRCAVGLVGLSVAVHLVGLFGYSGYEAWHKRHDFSDQGRCLFALRDTQIEAHARATLRKCGRALRPSGEPSARRAE